MWGRGGGGKYVNTAKLPIDSSSVYLFKIVCLTYTYREEMYFFFVPFSII